MKTLDATALERLTGYRQPTRQARWVREQLGLEPMIGADGRPRLTEHIIEQAALARRVGRAQMPAPGGGVSLPFVPKWEKAA